MNECLQCTTLTGSIVPFAPVLTNESDLSRKPLRKFSFIPSLLKKPHSFWDLEIKVVNISCHHLTALKKTNCHSRPD